MTGLLCQAVVSAWFSFQRCPFSRYCTIGDRVACAGHHEAEERPSGQKPDRLQKEEGPSHAATRQVGCGTHAGARHGGLRR